MNAEQAICRMRDVVRRQHKAWATESTYVLWLRRYMLAVPTYPEGLSSEQKLERFLTELARHRDISAVSQNQAINAILFFYRDVLGQLRAGRGVARHPCGADHGLIGDRCSCAIFQAPRSLTNTSVERSFLWMVSPPASKL